jgi:hypothetical protein
MVWCGDSLDTLSGASPPFPSTSIAYASSSKLHKICFFSKKYPWDVRQLPLFDEIWLKDENKNKKLKIEMLAPLHSLFHHTTLAT